MNNAAGIALSDLGRNDEAIVAFQSALKLNPNDTNSNFNLARALLSLDRRDEAIAHLERSLVQQPTFPDALSLLGRLELESDHLELAGRYLKRLYDSNPQAPAARQLMAEWHLRSGLIADKQQDSRSAERHYITGIELDPNASELYIRLGTLCLVQDRFTDALKPLEIFHHQQPNDPQGYLYLGQDYTKLGRIADARRILSEGVQVADHAGRSSTAAHCQTLLAQLPE